MRRVLKYTTAILGLALTMFTQAQQEQQYTQYFVNGFVLNPARAGTEDFIDARLGYRNQWTGFQVNDPDYEGGPVNPRTGYLSVHSNVGHHGTGAGRTRAGKPRGHHGVGGYIYDDKTGPIGRTGFYGAYAYNLPLNRDLRLSIGAFMGAKQFRINGEDWDAYDPVVLDDNLSDGQFSKFVPDAAVGAFLYSKYYFVGVSSFQVFRSKIIVQGAGANPEASNGRMYRHHFVTGGLKLPVASDITVIPSFAMKMVRPTPVSFDANVIVQYGNLYFLGVSTRLGSTNLDAISGVAGVTLWEQFDISYSYDLNLSGLRRYNTGSHEIVIGYRFKHPYHIDCPGRKFH